MGIKSDYVSAVEEMNRRYDLWLMADKAYENCCWLEYQAAASRVDTINKQLKELKYGSSQQVNGNPMQS